MFILVNHIQSLLKATLYHKTGGFVLTDSRSFCVGDVNSSLFSGSVIDISDIQIQRSQQPECICSILGNSLCCVKSLKLPLLLSL